MIETIIIVLAKSIVYTVLFALWIVVFFLKVLWYIVLLPVNTFRGEWTLGKQVGKNARRQRGMYMLHGFRL